MRHKKYKKKENKTSDEVTVSIERPSRAGRREREREERGGGAG